MIGFGDLLVVAAVLGVVASFFYVMRRFIHQAGLNVAREDDPSPPTAHAPGASLSQTAEASIKSPRPNPSAR